MECINKNIKSVQKLKEQILYSAQCARSSRRQKFDDNLSIFKFTKNQQSWTSVHWRVGMKGINCTCSLIAVHAMQRTKCSYQHFKLFVLILFEPIDFQIELARLGQKSSSRLLFAAMLWTRVINAQTFTVYMWLILTCTNINQF